jgi:4-hydroxy-tetrahydrodipicolinate synthase
MLTEAASGVFTIAATPFLPDGTLDLESVDRLVAFYEDKGATGLTILGMMGEAGKLTAEEARSFARRVIGRTALPVVVGVTAPGLAAMRTLAADVMDAGAAGVMVAPASGLTGDDRLVTYFEQVAAALGATPFVLQDFPLVTQVHLPVSVLLRIFEQCPTCVMLKHEDWPGLDKISALRAASDAGGRRVSILCGNGGLYLPEELARGADGAMTGFSYPEMMAEVVKAWGRGDETRAYDIFDAYLPLIRYEAQPGLGLAIRKWVLATRGAIAHATLRAPGAGLNAAAQAEIAHLVARQEKALARLGIACD